ncbi:MAG: peptidylprolyl isomerase [Rhodospirillales bacterium]
MMKFLIWMTVVLAWSSPWIGDALAQSAQRIAAVVNDEVISIRDLDSRLTLLIATSNLEDRPEIRRRLAPQVLRQLVDDVLKLQEAKRLNVVVGQDEIDRALDQIERQSNIPPGRLAEVLTSEGVSLATLIDQVEVEIAWVKAVSRLERGRVTIGDEEIDEEIKRIRAGAGRPQSRVAEILLPLDDPTKEAEVRQLAERLVDELRAGANFAVLARNFSQAASAAVGGDLGWIDPGQLGEPIDTVVQRLQPGQVSDPVRTTTGFHLIAVLERQIAPGLAESRITVTLHQVFLPIPADASPDLVAARKEEARALSGPAVACDDLQALNRPGQPRIAGSLGTGDLDQLPPDVRAAVEPLQPGQKSEPILAGGGVLVLMVCDRRGESAAAQQRDLVRQRLESERLGAAAQRYLRDLRRAAFVDVRI